MNIHPTYRYPNGLDEAPPPSHGGLRWLRRPALGAGALLLALLLVLALLVALAWLASNWQDAPPQASPAELAPPVSRLGAERNVAYALWGLHAAVERDPATVGKALWAASERSVQQRLALSDPAQAQSQVQVQVQAQSQAQAEADLVLLGKVQAWPDAAPWSCDPLQADCLRVYLEKSEALAQQRAAVAALGARCDAVVDALQPDKGWGFEELLPAQWHPAAALAPLQNPVGCISWMHSGAVLAFRQGRKDEAWRQMARSNQLLRAWLAGSHSLMAQTVVQAQWRRHLVWVGALAAQDPAWTAQALPLVQGLGAPEQWARRWLVVEAAVARAALRDPRHRAGHSPLALPGEPPPGLGARLWQRLSDRLMQHGIGWHPERTTQLLDRQWLARLKAVDGGLPQAIANPLAGAPGDDPSPLRWWRNPFGRQVVATALPAHTHYLRRHLDLELHREAVALALTAQRLGIAPAARAAWAQQQQGLSQGLRERLSWSADGRSLSVRSWAADADADTAATDAAPPDGRNTAAPARIQVTLDRATAP